MLHKTKIEISSIILRFGRNCSGSLRERNNRPLQMFSYTWCRRILLVLNNFTFFYILSVAAAAIIIIIVIFFCSI